MAKKRKPEPEPVERIHGMGLAADHEDVRRYLQAVTDDLRILDTHVLTEGDVIDALERLDPVWEELFPGERGRIAQLLVERVVVRADGLELRLRTDELRSLVAELMAETADTGARAS